MGEPPLEFLISHYLERVEVQTGVRTRSSVCDDVELDDRLGERV
jgi:hypothetical protein